MLMIDVSGISLLSQEHQKVAAQKDIQIRTDQWLKVEEVTGNVTYRNFYNYDNRPARVGDLLQIASDEISTGANGSAVLTVDTAVGSIYIAENTTIQIRSFRIAADNGRITNLFVPRGKVRLQIRKFTHRGSQINIQTPAGISGVRGTQYIAFVKPNGDMLITTIEGSVATTAQNQTEIVNGGFQNITVVGEPPSTPIRFTDDASLRYIINRQVSGLSRSISMSGYTSPFNTVKVDELEQSLDGNGEFSLKFPATSSLKVKVTVETPTGKIQVYEIPIL
ncbi:FecR domain-containing protein [Pseudanabaena sp. BC1403]|uniref:FecR family protein n=1 Tax=Pseudanabaena sp. BC1403 TaxID=2043171 RepID=UPI0015E1B1F4|nr:FecR family protein [Pseudanabaena sp. BC1403]